MAKYLDLLKLILSYGDKIPEILGRVENIINELRAIAALLGIAESFAADEPTAEVLALEAEVTAAAAGGAESFGGPFQRILDFIRNNPELIAFLLKFLK